MSIVYFDSSALVKLVNSESGSDIAWGLWDGCTTAVSSRVAFPEVCAALAAANRKHRLDGPELDAAGRSWSSFWSEMQPVELTPAREQHAGRLARTHALAGADAVHLASALAVRGADSLFAAWDQRLRRSARAAGLAVVPA